MLSSLGVVQAEAGRLPRPHNEKDAEKLLALAEKANEAAKDKAEIDADIVRKVAFTAAGELSPMAATLGGIVGQEVRGLPLLPLMSRRNSSVLMLQRALQLHACCISVL